MTRTSQQECRGILEKIRDGNRIKAEKKAFTGYVLLRENTVCGIIMEV